MKVHDTANTCVCDMNIPYAEAQLQSRRLIEQEVAHQRVVQFIATVRVSNECLKTAPVCTTFCLDIWEVGENLLISAKSAEI